VDYEVLYRRMTPEVLVQERESCREYRKGGKDFDPKPFETDEWFDSWCHDSLIRTEGRIYRASTTFEGYYEGMKEAGVPEGAFQRYERGRQEFSVEIRGSYVELMVAMQAITGEAIEFVMQRRRQEREKEKAEREQSKVGSP